MLGGGSGWAPAPALSPLPTLSLPSPPLPSWPVATRVLRPLVSEFLGG